MKKKIILSLITICMSAACFTGCGTDSQTNNVQQTVQQPVNNVQQVNQSNIQQVNQSLPSYLKYCGKTNKICNFKHSVIEIYEDPVHKKVLYVGTNGFSETFSMAISDFKK